MGGCDSHARRYGGFHLARAATTSMYARSLLPAGYGPGWISPHPRLGMQIPRSNTPRTHIKKAKPPCCAGPRFLAQTRFVWAPSGIKKCIVALCLRLKTCASQARRYGDFHPAHAASTSMCARSLLPAGYGPGWISPHPRLGTQIPRSNTPRTHIKKAKPAY
jgi:hypothetical protein